MLGWALNLGFAAGTIEDALWSIQAEDSTVWTVQLTDTNLIADDIEDAEWTKTRLSVSGTLATENNGNNTHLLSQLLNNVNPTVYNVITGRLKTNGRNKLEILWNNVSGSITVKINVDTGTVESQAAASNAVIDSVVVTGDGSDWVGFTIIGTLGGSTGLQALSLYFNDDNWNQTYNGDGASGMYMDDLSIVESEWSAQTEDSTTWTVQ